MGTQRIELAPALVTTTFHGDCYSASVRATCSELDTVRFDNRVVWTIVALVRQRLAEK